jgi:hypothetical protein
MRSIMVHSCSRAFCRQHWASDSVSSLYIFKAQLVLFVDMQHLSIFLRPTLSLSGHQGDRRRTCSGAWRNAAPEVAQRRALFDAMVAAPTPQPSHNNNNNITMNSQSRWSPTHAANFAAPSQSRAPRWILHKADPTGEGGWEAGREGDPATLHECLPPQHSPTLRPPISRIERPPTPRLSSSLDSRTTRARGIPFAALASVPSGFVLVRVRAVWIHRIAHCALPHSTPSTPTPTTGPRAVSSAIPQVRVALSSREKFKS